MLFLLLVSCSGYYTVGEQERAVLLRWGEAQRVESPGLHFKIPYADSVYKVNVALDSQVTPPESGGLNTYTIDNQELDAWFRVVFRVSAKPEAVLNVYRNVPDYRERIYQLVSERFKRELGKVNIQDFAVHRGKIASDTLAVVKDEALRLFGIEIIDFQITNAEYTKAYKSAVQDAALAKQRVQTNEQELSAARVAAQTVKVVAQGLADGAVVEAQGAATATKLAGDAEASAIRAKAAALAQNKGLVELEKAQRWDGKLPVSVGLGSSVPFIDVRAVEQDN